MATQRRPRGPALLSRVSVPVLALALLWSSVACTASDMVVSDPGERADAPASVPSSGTGLPRGEDPAVDVVRGTVLHRPDGSTLDLELEPQGGVTAVTRHRDRLYVTGGLWFEGTVNMSQLEADGTYLGSWGTTGPVVSSPDGEIAYVDIVPEEAGAEEPASISVVDADGKHRTQQITEQTMPRLLGFVDGKVVYNARFRTEDGTWATGQFSTDLSSEPRQVEPHGAPVFSPGGDAYYQNAPALDAAEDDGLIGISIGGHVDSMAAGTLHDMPGVWENDESLLFLRIRGERAVLVRYGPGGVERVGEWTDAVAQKWDVPVRAVT